MKEPKAMQEIHKIREHLSKLSKEELERSLVSIRKKYRKIMVP